MEVEVDDEVIGFLVVSVEFLRDEIVVLRFTVRFVDATGFLVVFITVDVAFFDGFKVVTGLRVIFVVAGTTVGVRLLGGCVVAGFLVRFVGFVPGFFVLCAVLVVGCFDVGFVVAENAVDEATSMLDGTLS